MRLVAPPYWFVPALIAAFALCLAIVVIALIIGPASASYNVTAQTERIALSIDRKPSWRWVLRDVEFFENGASFESWNGDIELAHSVDVLIQRIAFGVLWVHVQCQQSSNDEACDSAGVVFDASGLSQRPLASEFEILIGDIPARAKAGTTIWLEIAGQVTLGRSVGTVTDTRVALLREGRVTMLGRNVLGGGVFDGGSVALDIGDRFEVTDVDEKSETRGFVVADERPAMTVAYRVIGSNAVVYRPGGGHYAVSTSVFARFIGDPLFRLLAALFAFAAAGTQAYVSILQILGGANGATKT